jgi:uncharacterized protein
MQVQIPAVERNWAMAAHLSALVGLAGVPFGHVVGPLVVYLVKGHESEFVAEHARASLNYQLTITIVGIIAAIVGVAAAFGFILPMHWASESTAGFSFAVLWFTFIFGALGIVLATLIFIILGTVAASEGRPYTYPFAIRFLK